MTAMRARVACLLVVLGVLLGWIYQGSLTAAEAGDAAPIRFGGESYNQSRRISRLAQDAVEYVRAQEAFDRWTKRLATRYLPYDQDALDYANAVKDTIAFYNPEAKATSEHQPGDAEAYLEFEQWDPKNPQIPLEVHLAQVRRDAGGLRIQEMTYRSTEEGPARLENARAFIAVHRAAWRKELAEAKWSQPMAKPSMAASWKNAVADIRWYIHAPHVFVENKRVDVPFTLGNRPKPPEKAWLYVRPIAVLEATQVSMFLDSVRAFRITGLDLKKQPSVKNDSLSQILEENEGWPLEPGWQKLIDGLRYLNVKGSSVNDGAAPILAKMLPLQVLILGDKFTDNSLPTIAASLANLSKFRPGGPAITDRGMQALKSLTKLHRLDLSDTSVTAEGLKALKGLPIKEVDMGKFMNDDALKELISIPTLVHLEMANSPITDEGVAFLKSYARLHTLFIGSQLDDAGVQSLIQIPALRRLDVSGSRITDEGLKALSTLKELQELAVTHTAVTDQGLASLSGLTKLRFLEVSDSRVTVGGLCRLTNMPELDVISFTHEGPLKLGELKALGALPALRTVIINGAPLKREAIKYLHEHAQPPKVSSRWQWVREVFADALPVLSDDVDVAKLVDKPSSFAIRSTGLRRIHNVESDLDNVIPDVSNPMAAIPQETEENFLGEFTVNAATPPPKRVKK